MTTYNKRNKDALALVAVAVILAGILAPAMSFKNAYADVTKTIADAQNAATGQQLNSGGKTVYGQIFTEQAIGNLQEVDCMSVSIRKGGSPTGTAYIGLIDRSDRSVDYTFGTKDVSTLTTSYTVTEFCNTGSDGLLINALSADVFLGVKFEGGDASNYLDVRRSNTGAGPDYDGTASYHSLWDGSEWDDFTDRDLLFKLTNTYGVSEFDFPCDQLAGNDHAFVDSFSHEFGRWQDNGVGRCLPEGDTENNRAHTILDASLSGSTLTVTTTVYYDSSHTMPVQGLNTRIYEGSLLRDGLSNGLGVYTTQLTGLSAGAHTIELDSWAIDFVSPCSTGTIGSGITCTEDAPSDGSIELTFTVA